MPNEKIDWDKEKTELENQIQQDGFVIALRHHWIVSIELDETYTELDRTGYLTCGKPKVKCRVHHAGVHESKVSLEEERITRIAESMSNKIHAEISSKISTKLGGIGAEVAGKIGAEETSSTQITSEIRSALKSEETVTLETHADECKLIELPYGLAIVVTITGTLIVNRYFTIHQGGHIKWEETNFDTSGLNIDTSVDTRVFYDRLREEDTTCEPCPDEDRRSPVETPHETQKKEDGDH